MCCKVYDEEHGDEFEELLRFLDTIVWRNTVVRDSNRQSDGHDLRYGFGYEYHIPYREIDHMITGPVTVLEVLVAMAIRGEVSIMSDSEYGDRTSVWFWSMIECMHLLDEYQDYGYFNWENVRIKVDNMMDRNFAPNGDGGLFVVNDPPQDMRTAEFWYQMNWYFNTL